jgi:tetratricopeptide (TPR) repeat protein
MTNLHVKESFSYWAANPNDTMASDVAHLEDAIKIYPYCQILYLLAAKAANIHEPERLVETTNRAAAYSLSRKALRMLVLKEFEWSDNLMMRQLTTKLIDYQKESYPSFKPKHFDLNDLTQMAKIDFDTIGRDTGNLIDDTTIRESAIQAELELLKGNNTKKIEANRQLQMEIIESFIEKETKLSPLRANLNDQSEQEDLIKKRSIVLNKGVVSEGMAKILLRQGKIEKAIEMYEQLILKKPEKKAYFAEKIKELSEG